MSDKCVYPVAPVLSVTPEPPSAPLDPSLLAQLKQRLDDLLVRYAESLNSAVAGSAFTGGKGAYGYDESQDDIDLDENATQTTDTDSEQVQTDSPIDTPTTVPGRNDIPTNTNTDNTINTADELSVVTDPVIEPEQPRSFWQWLGDTIIFWR